MRCLGIPNTAHFANVTQIEDAVSCKSVPSVGVVSVCLRPALTGDVFVFSVGEAKVAEGVGAMAAGHRGKHKASWTECDGV